MRKATVVKDSQVQARVLTGTVVGSRDEKRWIVQDDQKGRGIDWVNGAAQPTLLQESKGYVRAVVHRTVQKVVYENAPLHRVEIWRHVPAGEFHVRIFEELIQPAAR
jgi:hypothetical protein